MSDFTAEAINRYLEELAQQDERSKAAGPISLDELRSRAEADPRQLAVRVREASDAVAAAVAHANEMVPPWELLGNESDRSTLLALLELPDIAKRHLVAYERCPNSGFTFLRAYRIPAAHNGVSRLLVAVKSSGFETVSEPGSGRPQAYRTGHRAEDWLCLAWDENRPPAPHVIEAACPECRHQVGLDRVVKMAATRRTGLKGRRR